MILQRIPHIFAVLLKLLSVFYCMGIYKVKESNLIVKPILKWVGGKSQMIDDLLAAAPKNFNKYIEPFFGGGALFFRLLPPQAIISDSNPELINLYKCIRDDVNRVIHFLQVFSKKNTKEEFYEIRKINWQLLEQSEAAARTIYLNKTCFNGLYRVNKFGQFNVPYGNYKNPNILDEFNLINVSIALKGTTILSGDYKDILIKNASEGDFIFLDPPYLPISAYADFKRYTKEQFYEEDHQELAVLVHELVNNGCHVILTNSNHPLVHELFNKYNIQIFKTRRNISSNGGTRTGEDVIVTAKQSFSQNIRVTPKDLNHQVRKFPSTRFMGSKQKLLGYIQEVTNTLKFNTVADLFSGSGIVSYYFKSLGKEVYSNDYMALAANFSKALVENNNIKLNLKLAESLLIDNDNNDHFVEKTFEGLYYSTEDNKLIDIIRSNIKGIENKYERSIATFALTRACTKKRPRGIFTYVGHRYDDNRRDITLPFADHFLEAVSTINNAVFDNDKKNISKRDDALNINWNADLVYLDPPYYSPLSDNEYVRRYHFIEGLACDWKDVEWQHHTKTKKFKSYPSPFSSRIGALSAFDNLIRKYRESIVLISYSSNSEPTMDELARVILKYKSRVEIISVDYKYSFGTQNHKVNNNKNSVSEYLFLGY